MVSIWPAFPVASAGWDLGAEEQGWLWGLPGLGEEGPLNPHNGINPLCSD